jgi:hypothetical protein
MPIHDEADLRAALRALGDPQPPQPAARVEAAVGEAARIRRRRATVTAALALVPLVVVGVLVAPRPPERRGPTPLTAWPTRPLDLIASNALEHWRFRGSALRADEAVRLLYSAQVPGSTYVVVVFATCTPERCSRLVLAHALAKDVPEIADDEGSSWSLRTEPLDETKPVPVLSEYLSTEFGSLGPRNVLFVLTGPDAARVAWSSAPRRPGSGGSGQLSDLGGAFAGDVGYLSSPAIVTVSDAGGGVLAAGPVGEPEDVPNAAWTVGEVEVPNVYAQRSTSRGQVRDPEGQGFGRGFVGPYWLFVRCVGDAPLRVTARDTTTETPCDDRSRLAAGPLTRAPGEAEVFFEISSGDPYTVASIALAERA